MTFEDFWEEARDVDMGSWALAVWAWQESRKQALEEAAKAAEWASVDDFKKFSWVYMNCGKAVRALKDS